MRASLLTVVVSLAAAAIQIPHTSVAQCPGDETSPPNIVGTWEWVDTSGGIAGERFSSESTGYAVQVEFLDTGTMLVYRDLALLHTTSYALSHGPMGWTVIADSTSTFPHPPLQYQAPFFCVFTQESPDGLLLNARDSCVDCYASVYALREL
jgi:hypothetical protein